MRPTRRVLLAIGVLLLTLALSLLVTWYFRSRELGRALIADVHAALGRTIERSPKPAAPRHDNGYACFGALMDVAPKDLGPFEAKNRNVFQALLDGGVTADVQERMIALAPWADAVRSCGDSARLQFVDGVTPFTAAKEPRGERGTQVILALSRMTRLEAKMLSRDGHWEPIVQHCAGTLEVALDRSHLNLTGAMIAASAVRQLTPACGEALQHVSSEEVASRFAALPGRLVANHEFLEVERLCIAVAMYGWLLTDDERATLPAGDFQVGDALDDPALRLALVRLWRRHDRAMRQLVAAADVRGPARLEASRGLDAAFSGWWMPASIHSPDYAQSLERNEDTLVLLRLLESLAAGGSKPLPPQVARTDAGFEFTDSKGEKLLIPSPAPP